MTTPINPRPKAALHTQNSKPTAAIRPRNPSNNPNEEARAPKPAQTPRRLVILTPEIPLSAIDDDPVLATADAAQFLGASEERLKKWRQRGQGPDFYQYEDGGAVRYLLSDLRTYRESSKRRMRRRRARRERG